MSRFAFEVGRDCGYGAVTEAYVPSLGFRERRRWSGDERKMVTTVEAAVLDCLWLAHSQAPDRIIDVTLRSPLASEIVQAASTSAGTACRAGDRDKLKHYGPTVTCWAAEAFGRLSETWERDLDRCAILAAENQKEKGWRTTRWAAKWRTRVSHMLARFAAVAVENSFVPADGLCLPAARVQPRPEVIRCAQAAAAASPVLQSSPSSPQIVSSALAGPAPAPACAVAACAGAGGSSLCASSFCFPVFLPFLPCHLGLVLRQVSRPRRPRVSSVLARLPAFRLAGRRRFL